MMLKFIKTVIFVVIGLLAYLSDAFADVILDTPLGQIKGLELTTPNGTAFHAFLGIPFAKPPLGELRFQAPKKPENWTGILDATKDINICYSVSSNSPYENEDCLYVNVFTPVLNPENDEKLPVMFRIYGGGFTSGNARYGNGGPEWFLEQGVIVVTFNYRVGPFGFLSTGDTVLPGNAGLKDQLLALKWTNKNIANFGGDPMKITIGGQSAGGASVGFHLLSKKSKGLYRAAIAESGAPICIWAYNGSPREYALSLAQAINSSFDTAASSSDLVKYLQSIEAKDIDAISPSLASAVPVIEVEHEDAFITDRFYEILASGDVNKVPLFIGFNSEEQISLGANPDNLKKSAEAYDKNVKGLVPASLNAIPDDKQKIGEIIKDLYVGNGTFEETPGLYIRYSSDNRFIRAVIQFAKLYSNIEDVYLYEFSYDGVMGNINITVEGADKVGHSEETRYLFVSRSKTYDNTKEENFPASDIVTHKRLLSLFTNFIKYLNPTPENTTLLQNIRWPTTNSNSLQYLDIDEDLEIKTNPKDKYFAGWEKIFDTWGQRPFVTY